MWRFKRIAGLVLLSLLVLAVFLAHMFMPVSSLVAQSKNTDEKVARKSTHSGQSKLIDDYVIKGTDIVTHTSGDDTLVEKKEINKDRSVTVKAAMTVNGNQSKGINDGTPKVGENTRVEKNEQHDDKTNGVVEKKSPYLLSWDQYMYWNQKYKILEIPMLPPPSLSRKDAKKKLIVYYQVEHSLPKQKFSKLCNNGKTCEITFDTSDHGRADAIVFHVSRIRHTQPPFKKKPGQIWIARGLESPAHWRKGTGSRGWRGLFNWTMTYRVDSDFFCPLGYVVALPGPPKKDFKKIASEKTRSIAWFVSKCSTNYKWGSRREDYVQQLKKYIDVDIFGDCSPRKCPKTDKRACYSMLTNKYRFYLAFENSLCKGYITEKPFNKYKENINVVPIVMGGADYTNILPEGTYINTADFPSPKALAKHLTMLRDDIDAYAAILERKARYVVDSKIGRHNAWCDLCDRLHAPNQESQVYEDLLRWWEKDACFEATNFSWWHVVFSDKHSSHH